MDLLLLELGLDFPALFDLRLQGCDGLAKLPGPAPDLLLERLMGRAQARFDTPAHGHVRAATLAFDQPTDGVWPSDHFGVLVDLAHASVASVGDALRAARRPLVISHTGFAALAGGRSRWRRYAPATRNLPDGIVREAGAAGALIGVTFATDLIGGTGLDAIIRSFAHALELVGPHQVAIGSDFDGALRMPFDVLGLPALTGALRAAGFDDETVAGLMGGNALRMLESWIG